MNIMTGIVSIIAIFCLTVLLNQIIVLHYKSKEKETTTDSLLRELDDVE